MVLVRSAYYNWVMSKQPKDITRQRDKVRRERRTTKLREWRNYNEITLREAAAVIGRTYATLQRIEKGVLPYNQDVLEALYEFYGASKPTDLIDISPPKPRR